MPVQVPPRGTGADRPAPDGGVSCLVAERTMVAVFFRLPTAVLDPLEDGVIEAMAAHLSGDRHRRDELIAAVVADGPVVTEARATA